VNAPLHFLVCHLPLLVSSGERQVLFAPTLDAPGQEIFRPGFLFFSGFSILWPTASSNAKQKSNEENESAYAQGESA
jgi:hypothetical protein